ncbi:MAG: tRNA 2-selenouridine(34) synthase MnmH [Bacteroidota bacterium]|jgi:tRNA 2-selenouridine synthase
MAIQKLTIQDFLSLAGTNSIVLDVRSPGEYLQAHIPGAHSLPLFTDDERKVVGTAYKQQSRQQAIKIGLDYFGVKMRRMVEEVEAIIPGLADKQKNSSQPNSMSVLVHCWRGGMRSAGVAWLLDLYGFKVYTLAGGYKAYRKWVRDQFEKEYPLLVLGGYTGSGKTKVLELLPGLQQPIINLELLAQHKGSAFGALGQQPQPRQEMFENLLAHALNHTSSNIQSNNFIWVEDESQRIGNLKIPDPFWKQMRNCPVIFTDIPFEIRLQYITREYGMFEKEKLVNAIIRIQKRLGGLETKTAIGFLLENNYKECFRILLNYYDKWYRKGLHNRDNPSQQLHTIHCTQMDAAATALAVTQQAALIQTSAQSIS